MQKIKSGGIYGTVKKLSGTSYFEVVEPFFWIIDYGDKEGWIIVAEKGFKSNFGSIPRILRFIFDPTRYNSYVLHDACYSNKVKYHIKNNEYDLITRKEADLILLEGLAYEGAGFIEKTCIYLGVRLGGWVAWW